MKISAFHMHAFSGSGFDGNPAMVCILDHWLPDERLAALAMDNALPATAFLVDADGETQLRWFTPTVELEICGHGTLAAAAVLFRCLDRSKSSVTFQTQSGDIKVFDDDGLVRMNLAVGAFAPCKEMPVDLVDALGKEPREVFRSNNYLAVFDSEDEIRGMEPDFSALEKVDCLGAIVTSRGREADFVSRYFAPGIGIREDAATGSTHCVLAPYWSGVLGKTSLHAQQLSSRGGQLWCEVLGGDVVIRADARLESKHTIHV